jgi:acetylornithine deacetylase/succinyl-diaminopimelate desuccinylase-like protein
MDLLECGGMTKGCPTARWRLIPIAVLVAASLSAQGRPQPPDWTAVEAEALEVYQTLIRFDTSATERLEAEYLKRLFDRHGIPAQVLSKDPERPNVVARLAGTGKKRPLLLLGHLDTVTVDASKWKFPPFSATRDGGFIYGRGAIDDKDNLAAAVMTMLLLKRQNVPLDRDVILLAESGEEGASNLGMGFMVGEHYPLIDAEYCIAEGGDTIREGGEVRYATVQVTEKVVRGVELTAKGISGHGSVPLTSNAIAHLGNAVGKFISWQPDLKIDETTGRYFRRLATLAAPEKARYYRDLVSPDPKVAGAAAEWLFQNEPRHASMARTSVSPNIFTGGYRSNVIPSEAKARLDVRMVPGEDPEALLAQIRKAINDPAIDVQFAGGGAAPRPAAAATRLDSELFTTVETAVQTVYKVPTVPSMSTYATDMIPLRARGVQCVGIGAGVDLEDQSAGFGMHADQERLLEGEFQRFVRLNWEVVTALAGAR